MVVLRSVLELVVGGLPFPHGGPNGEWRYRHAVRRDGPSEFDHQAVADFLSYETQHRRHVEVVAADALSDWADWPTPGDRPDPGAFATQCCSDAFAQGCGSGLVCHGAPAAVACQILEDEALLAATVATGRSAEDLAEDSTWGEPPDYFSYVMFANGRCTAPEAVALSRSLRRDLVPSDLSSGYPPAVRFYFDWSSLASRHDAAFDGVHPVKIRERLPLDESLVGVVVHPADLPALSGASTDRIRDRLVVVDLDAPTPDTWSSAALEAAEQICC